MGTRAEYLKDIATEGVVMLGIGAGIGGISYALAGDDFFVDLVRGAGVGSVVSLSFTALKVQAYGLSTRRYAKIHARAKNSRLESAFYAVEPGTIYQRGSWWDDLRQSWKIRRMQRTEQAGADMRDTYAPARERMLVYHVGRMQLTYAVVSKFLRQAERNRDQGRSFSKRYWTQDNQLSWWLSDWYDPMMVLIRTAQAKSGIQLFDYNPGNGWSKIIYSAPYTYGVVREHWQHKRYVPM